MRVLALRSARRTLIKEIKDSVDVQVPEIKPGETHFPCVYCCCYSESIYYAYPDCCGLQSGGAMCCGRGASSIKCMQTQDEYKAMSQEIKAGRCLDYTEGNEPCGGGVFTESAQQLVACCCVVGSAEDECYCSCKEGTFPGAGTCLCSGQNCCFQVDCQLPPGDKVPFGIGCCGVFCVQPEMPEKKTDEPAAAPAGESAA